MKKILFYFIEKKNFRTDYLLSAFFILVLFILWISGFLQKYITPAYVVDGKIITFGDNKDVLSWIKCWSLGINIVQENSCTLRHKLTYGFFITYIPYNFILFFILDKLMPIIFAFGLIFSTVYFTERKKFLDLLLISFAIFNPHTLLLIERGNWDLYIYFSIILICLTKNRIYHSILIILTSLIKYFPILMLSIFFLKKNIKKIDIFFLFFSISIIFLFIIYHYEVTYEIFTKNLYGASERYSFSFISVFNITNRLFVEETLILYSPIIFLFFLLIFFTIKIIAKNNADLNIDEFEEKMFFLSSSIILFCYFLFSSFYYRDTFLLLSIPFLVKIRNKNKEFNFILIIVFLRYVYNFFSNNFIIWRRDFELLVIRNYFDFIVISIILIIWFAFTYKLIKNIFLKKR